MVMLAWLDFLPDVEIGAAAGTPGLTTELRGFGTERSETSRYLHPTFDAHPSASMAPSIAAALVMTIGVFRFACLSDRRERVRNRPFAARNAGDPAQFAGRLRGMSGFAYFCRNKSRSRKPAQPTAKRLLTF